MEQATFRALVEEHLLPLFSGAQIDDGIADSTSRRATVRYTTICSMEIKPTKTDVWCLRVTRSQPFTQVQGGKVSEHSIASAFVAGLDAMPKGFENGPFS